MRLTVDDRSYVDMILATPGLVAYWRLGDRSGSVARDYGGRYHGTYNASPALGALGPLANDLGRAVTLTAASGQYVASPTMPDLPLGAGARTIECWMNVPVAPDARQGFMGYGDAGTAQVFNIEYIPGQGLYLVGYGTGDLAPTPNVLLDGKWHHIAGTYDRTTAYLYNNGLQVGVGARALNSVAASKALGIGRQSYPNGSFYYVGGRIAEAAVYSRALSALELAEHNAAGRGAL